jgi:hypothetical protein
MENMKTNLRLAALSSMLVAALKHHGHLNPIPAPRLKKSANWYPHSSKRQSERLERQRANKMLDYSASEKCLAAIKAR